MVEVNVVLNVALSVVLNVALSVVLNVALEDVIVLQHVNHVKRIIVKGGGIVRVISQKEALGEINLEEALVEEALGEINLEEALKGRNLEELED